MKDKIWWFIIGGLLLAPLANTTVSQVGMLVLRPLVAAVSTFTNEVNGLMGGSNSPQPPSELPGE